MANKVWKYIQYYWYLGKYKSKKGGTVSYQLYGKTLVHLVMKGVGKHVEKKKLLRTTGGMVNWYIHCGEQFDNN